ncbi:MAG: ATP-binding protein [Solirubrobacteraceae bacterium]
MRCPYAACDGSGWVVVGRVASECRCMPEQRARRQAAILQARIPRRFQDADFDRPPVSHMDRAQVRHVREYVDALEENLAAGRGLWLTGPAGTGKTTLAAVVAKHAIRAGRTVAIYSVPHLLATIRRTYDKAGGPTTAELLEALASVDLLQLDDLGAEQPTPWVLEQLYTIINSRYEAYRSVTITTNLDPGALQEQVTERTVSRLEEMCSVVLSPDQTDHRRPTLDPHGPPLGLDGTGGYGDAPPRPAPPATWGADGATDLRPRRRRVDDGH